MNYKISKFKWFGEIPSHWAESKISYLFSIGRGRVISSQEIKDDGKYPVYSSQTKDDGCMGMIDTYDFDDNLITWTTDGANAGTVFIRSGKFNCTNVCGTLKPLIEVHLKFYFYYLQFATQFYKRPDTNGAKIMNNEMAGIHTLVPPLEEQTKIASYLDKKTAQIDAIIDKKQNLLNLLDEKKKAVINEAVTKGLNPNAPMKDSGIEWIGEIPEEYDIKSLKYLAKVNPSTAITDDTVTFLPMEKVKEDWSFEKGSFGKFTDFSVGLTKFQKNDILVAKITPCFENGKGVLLEELETNFGVGSTEFHIIRSGDIELAKYISYVIRSSSFMQVGEANMTGSAGQKRVPTDFLNNYPICLPASRLEMVKTTDYLDKFIDQLSIIKLKVNFQLEKLKEYRQSLISEAVTGKIDVSNYN
ncbi:restriction endonuclease subunit S [Kaistella carnis]|uniref:restriction endonuclease subunit S n=1 Tax=Kaistella carnis TaxID=1241979 RepID=UPI0028988166|nr:restriction endonuclease subunit S [Kaistella carnis]